MKSSLQGKRVTAELFGRGTVTEHPLCGTLPGMAQVLWDEPPPREYSFANPCCVLVEWLTEEPTASLREGRGAAEGEGE
jgi:hypothetical protein